MLKNLCRRPRTGWILVPALLVAVSAFSARAAGPPLVEGIPADAFVYGGWSTNPERAYMKKYQEAVWEEFKATGILDDACAMCIEMVPAEAREQVEGSMKMVMELVSGVDWNALGEKESAWAMSMGEMAPKSVNLFRVDKEKLPGIVSGMGKIFDAVVGMQPMVSRVNETPEGGAAVHGLGFPGVPFGFFITTVDDILVFSNERSALKDTVARLGGAQGTSSLGTSSRFRASLAKLPAPEDSVMYFDVAVLMNDAMAKMNGLISQMSSAPGEENAEVAQMRKVMDFLQQHVNVVDTIVTVGYTEGYRNLTASYVQFQDKVVDSIGYQLKSEQPMIEGFQRYVPKDAVSFAMDSGINPGAMYRFALDFVTNYVPDGAKSVAEWNEMQKQQLGFNVHDQILSKIRGDSVSVSFPAKAVNPFGGASNSSVMMLGVNDSESLAAMLDGVVEQLSKMAGSQGLPISIVKVSVVEGSSFHSIMIPMAPFMQPVFGFHGNHLYLANSADAVKRIIGLANDPSDNILANPRFTALGMVPYTPVSKISYRNLEQQYQKMAQTLGSAGMMLGMATTMAAGQIPDRGDGSKEMIMNVVSKVTAILPKLAPVVAKIDYYQDRTSFSYFDKNAKAYVTRSATSIRPPKKATEAGADTK